MSKAGLQALIIMQNYVNHCEWLRKLVTSTQNANHPTLNSYIVHRKTSHRSLLLLVFSAQNPYYDWHSERSIQGTRAETELSALNVPFHFTMIIVVFRSGVKHVASTVLGRTVFCAGV